MNPGHSYVLFLIAATAFCLVGCGPEREIEAKAKQICAYGQLDGRSQKDVLTRVGTM